MFYDSRYVTESTCVCESLFSGVVVMCDDRIAYTTYSLLVAGDIYHRLWNVALLVVLGVAVLHIQPVKDLEHASQNPSMFAFCLMLVVERLLVILLYLEVYIAGVGQPAIKPASLRNIRNESLCLPFYIAAVAVAGSEYFGEGGHGNNRLLAEESTSSSEQYGEPTDVPIYLCLFGYVIMLVLAGMNLIFCFPKGDEFKEL